MHSARPVPGQETMRLLSDLGIPIADYDLAEDIKVLELIGGK